MQTTTTRFGGMVPRLQSFILPDTNSQISIDANLLSGGLEAFRADVPVQQLDKLYSDMYLYRRGSRYYINEDPYAGAPQWLFFEEHKDVVSSPVFDDVANQMYVTYKDEFRVFDSNTLKLIDTTINSSNSLLVGLSKVDQPSMQLVAESTSTVDDETRAYVVCSVREWQSGKLDIGEPSLPAKQSTGETFIDMVAGEVPQITFERPEDYLERGITHLYVYRSRVTIAGEATYALVIMIDIRDGAAMPVNVERQGNTFIFKDTVATLDLQDSLVSSTWQAPPDNLQGIISMRNGILAGFLDKTVYISEPNMPHAWPEAYRIPTDYEIVGLGVFGNTLVICTKGYTFVCVVSNPSAALLIPIQEAAPCVSKRSIVSMTAGVLYASKLGIFHVNGSGAQLITKQLITDKEWEIYNPETMRATPFQNRYAVFFDGKNYEINGFVVDFVEANIGLQGISTYADAIWYDDITDSVYVIYKHPAVDRPFLMRFAEGSQDSRNMLWRSKQYFSDDGLFTLAAGKINFYDDSKSYEAPKFSYIESSNAFDVNVIDTFSISGDANTNARNFIDSLGTSTRFRLYINNKFRYATPIFNNKPFRLPAGFRGDSYYFEVEGTLPVKRVQVATSIGELT